MKKVLVTGGLGYIGTNLSIALLKAGYDVTIVDNLNNSVVQVDYMGCHGAYGLDEVLDDITALGGKEPKFYQVNVLDKYDMNKIFSKNGFDLIIHLAASKPSLTNPVHINDMLDNTSMDVNLFKLMQTHGVKNIIYASSASVYGNGFCSTSEHFVKPLSVYGMTKNVGEQLLDALCNKDKSLKALCLRYFNPLGGHLLGKLKDGDKPAGIIGACQTAVETGEFTIEGKWCNTDDYTPIRDYIHMGELVDIHLRLIEKLPEFKGVKTLNVGTGKGTSVSEFISEYKAAFGVDFYTCRSKDDDLLIDRSVDADKELSKLIGYTPKKTLSDIFKDYQKNHN